jgi:hypothetical protein
MTAGVSENVKARIDRALANESLLLLYPVFRVQHLSAIELDHCFVLATLQKQVMRKSHGGHHSFRYENVWQTHHEYDKVISDMWSASSRVQGQQGLADSLKQMQTGMNSCGTKTFGNFKHKLTVLRKDLERLRHRSVHTGPSHEEKKLTEKIKEVLYQEEVWIRQRSRVMWLKAGDRNSAYFHAQVAQRKRRNKIIALQRSDGTWCEDAVSVGREIQDFYTDMCIPHKVYQLWVRCLTLSHLRL